MTRILHFGLAAGLLLTGSSNTIVTKLMDIQCVPGLHGYVHYFNHPFFQTWLLMVSLLSCLGVYGALRVYFNWGRNQKELADDDSFAADYRREYSWFSLFIFIIPAFCDLTGATLLFIALLMTSPSVYQMLRGTIVIFTAMIGVIFLKHRLRLRQYVAIFYVVVGALLVGAASIIYANMDAQPPCGDSDTSISKNPLVGDILVITAQMIGGIQWNIEERLMAKYKIPPLRAVGAEGLWGLIMSTLLCIATAFIPGSNPPPSLDNPIDAFIQIGNSWIVLLCVISSEIFMAVLNVCSFGITRHMSATHRAVIDATRTVLVWVMSLAIGWERFLWLQLVGFLCLLIGTLMYSEVIPCPFEAYIERYLPACCRPLSEDFTSEHDEKTQGRPESDEKTPIVGALAGEKAISAATADAMTSAQFVAPTFAEQRVHDTTIAVGAAQDT